MVNSNHQYDVVVIGAGLAGLAFSLSLESRLKVGIFCKGKGPGGASSWAQGGLAAVVTAEDSVENHVNDTLLAGRDLCDPVTVHNIVSQGPDAVVWLEKMQVKLSRGEAGQLDLGQEGGHSRRRIVHATDATGAAIVDTLGSKVIAKHNVVIHPHQVAIDLIVQNGHIAGFYVFDRTTHQVATIATKAIVLATGGIGKVYRYTTNPDDSTGDGIAMAWRSGCQVANMEFVQFHPTALYHSQAKSFLISEAVRGEGAVLCDSARHRFLGNYHPDAELAPRDVVAQAIDSEMKRTGSNCMYLDFSPVDQKQIQSKFPSIVKKCAELGIDVFKDLVPVVPSAHYLCGGIVASINGVTNIPGLYAIGETAYTGLHGANRLASNSLLECIVVARGAARLINELNEDTIDPSIPQWDDSRVGPAHEEVMITHNWNEIRRMMWNYVGIVRSDERLARAQRRLELIAEEINEHYKRYVVSSDFIELRNLLLCAHLIIRSAASRRESRGLHYNLDCQEQTVTAKPTILCKETTSWPVGVTEQILHAN